jgi:hypothetical protein
MVCQKWFSSPVEKVDEAEVKSKILKHFSVLFDNEIVRVN